MEIRSVYALVAIAICLVHATGEEPDLHVPTDPGQEDLHQEVLSLDDMKLAYTKIPHLAVSHESREEQAVSWSDCQDICSEDAKCKSVSYRARDKKCLVSSIALQYAPGWKFNIKETKMGPTGLSESTGRYNKFDGIHFQDPKFEESDSDERTCRVRCDTDKNCGAYSFQGAMERCLLTGDGVQFDPEFDYYERNPDANSENDQGSAKSQEPLPEKEATKSEEQELKLPHFTPPDDSELNARMEKTRLRVQQVDKELEDEDPQFQVDPAKEKSQKKARKFQELEDKVRNHEKHKMSVEIFNVDAEAAKVRSMIRTQESENNDRMKAVAKKAFARGFKLSQMRNQKQYAEDKERVMQEGAAIVRISQESTNAKLARKAKERLDKHKSLEKRRASARASELLAKKTAHAAAKALSKQAQALIVSEGKEKSETQHAKESRTKRQHQTAMYQLAKNSQERSEKQAFMAKDSAAQTEKLTKFRLDAAKRENAEIEKDLELQAQEKEVQQALKRKQEEHDSQAARALGSQERSHKDEANAAAKAARIRQVSAYNMKIELKQTKEQLEKYQGKSPK